MIKANSGGDIIGVCSVWPLGIKVNPHIMVCIVAECVFNSDCLENKCCMANGQCSSECGVQASVDKPIRRA